MSAVDITKPEEVEATTASVRANMAIIKSELEVAEAHYAATDPHPQYTTEAEAAAIAAAAAAGVTVPVQSVAGKTGAVTLVKADVGLSAVDNTADADKPISTATATALSGKEADGTAAALVTAHEAASDPHPDYVTAAELATLSPRDHYTTHIVQGIL